MAYQRLLKNPSRRSEWLRSGLLLLSSIILIGLADWAGVTHAIDRSLENVYFRLRGQRSSAHSVVLVSLDENTIAEWGAPPWSWQRFDALIEQILGGNPSLVAMLEHGPRVLPESAPDEQSRVAQAERAGRLLLPKAEQYGRQALHIDTGPVTWIELGGRDGVPTLLSQVIERANLDRPPGSTLLINYLGSAASLPTVGAHRVASGEIPASTFNNRIVVIGLQGERFTPLVPTPVGPMSPAEVQAHAISGLVDGVVWHTVPLWITWSGIILLCMLGLFVVPKVPNRVVITLASALTALILVTDYWLFATGAARFGAASFLLASGIATFAAGLIERGRTQRELAGFSQWLLEQSGNEMQTRSIRTSDEEFLASFLRESQAFVEYESSIFAELPQGEHHLRLRIYVGTSENDILEQRRDVRRAPYLMAYQSHRPEWAEGAYMQKNLELKTLMVPLVELGRILGFWIINFHKDTALSRDKMRLIEILGNQASIALEHRRLYLQTQPTAHATALRSPSVLLSELRESRQTAASLIQSQYRVDELFERLPVGVLVSTLWGEIEQINAQMRTILHDAGVEDPGQMGLAELIARLSGEEVDLVHKQLREVMQAHTPLRISNRGKGALPVSGANPSYDLILTRVAGSGFGDTSDEGKSAAAHFVLTASEHTSKSATRGAWLQDVSAPADDMVNIRSKAGSGRN